MHDMNNDIAKVLISEEQLQAKVAELGGTDQPRLRGQRFVAGVYPERLRGVHGRFDARHHGTLQH